MIYQPGNFKHGIKMPCAMDFTPGTLSLPVRFGKSSQQAGLTSRYYAMAANSGIAKRKDPPPPQVTNPHRQRYNNRRKHGRHVNAGCRGFFFGGTKYLWWKPAHRAPLSPSPSRTSFRPNTELTSPSAGKAVEMESDTSPGTAFWR